VRVLNRVLLGMACVVFPALAEAAFKPYQAVASLASKPQAIKTADVNGDGLDDVIVATTRKTVADADNDYKLHVFLQQADGSLAYPIKIGYSAHGGDFAGLEVADIDKNGVQDVLVVHSLGVSVMLGSSTAAYVMKHGSWPISRFNYGSVVAVDVNLDGHLDAVAQSLDQSNNPGIWVFHGDGKGALTPAQAALPTPGYLFNGGLLTQGDLNGDGLQDLVLKSEANHVYLMLHVGVSGYLAPQPLPYSDMYAVSVGDFNADGRDDLIAARGSSPHGNIWVFTQGTDGVLAYSGHVPLVGDMLNPVVADVDGDGRDDLLVATQYRNSMGYYRQGATGLTYVAEYATPGLAAPRAVGDINHDGRADAVIADAANGLIVLYGRKNLRRALVARNDFNGDGRSDLFWRQAGTGRNVIWNSARSSTQTATATVANLHWHVSGSNDFDGDGRSDALWRNHQTGANVIWKSGNAASQMPLSAVTDLAWRIAGTGDFDADGRADILWRHAGTGANVIWRSANATTQMRVTDVTNLAWKVAGIGDFDGDDRSDILWRNDQTGANVIWRSGNAATQTMVMGVTDLAWQIVGTGDFDGDGRFDIAWRNHSTGANVIWKSAEHGSQLLLTGVTNQAWKVACVGDFDGDGRSDLVWRNSQTGDDAMWRSANANTQQPVTGVTDQAWQMIY